MKSFIAFSGGVESSTLALLMGYKANALFADTKFEHQVLYDRLALVEQAVRDWHKNEFAIIQVQNEKLGGLPDEIKDRKFYPSFKARFCTRQFKIEPIDDYLRQFAGEPGGVELMIGLNSDEADMRTGNQGALPFVNYTYPLIEMGINRAQCEAILSSANLHPNFPPYMRRGGCIGCYYKSKREFAAMTLFAPNEYQQVVELEEAIQDERGTYYHVIDGIRGLRAFRAGATAVLFEKEEMYPAVTPSSSCGLFCNR